MLLILFLVPLLLGGARGRLPHYIQLVTPKLVAMAVSMAATV